MGNKFRIAFFDLDWTLYDHENHRWDEESLKAIKAIKQKGVKVVFVTARNYDSASRFGVFDLGIEWDAYITSAGAVAFYGKEHEVLSRVDEETIRKFIQVCERIGSTFEIVCVYNRILIGGDTLGLRNYYHDFMEVKPSQREYAGEEATGFNFFDDLEKEALVKKEFPELIYYRYHDYAVDITTTPHVKGDAMNFLLEHFGLKKEDAIAFGDGDQDISMKKAATFVAMGNAADEVKKEGDFVTDSVMNSGVSKALMHFELL